MPAAEAGGLSLVLAQVEPRRAEPPAAQELADVEHESGETGRVIAQRSRDEPGARHPRHCAAHAVDLEQLADLGDERGIDPGVERREGGQVAVPLQASQPSRPRPSMTHPPPSVVWSQKN